VGNELKVVTLKTLTCIPSASYTLRQIIAAGDGEKCYIWKKIKKKTLLRGRSVKKRRGGGRNISSQDPKKD